MYNMTTTKERLIASTRDLLWERGYVGTSPQAILDASGAGLGSMYHHFRGKEALASAAIEQDVELMRSEVSADLSSEGSALDRIRRHMLRDREVLRGCRLGKLTQDAGVTLSAQLMEPIEGFFSWLRAELANVITNGQASGEITKTLDPHHTAAAIAATLQGGYVLACASGDDAAFASAIAGILRLLELASERSD
jgi:AcrR family transcriptional regulator